MQRLRAPGAASRASQARFSIWRNSPTHLRAALDDDNLAEVVANALGMDAGLEKGGPDDAILPRD